MGYGTSSLTVLKQFVEQLPPDGSILELGQQNIEPGVSLDALLACARCIHSGDEAKARRILEHYDGSRQCPVSELFRDSPYRYTCLDLYPGEFTIVADLNEYEVPDSHKGRFDLVTNIGTSEHVTDQLSLFRAVHDFAKVGGNFWHSVPFTGYFNHGLYNYHPLFFVFLAAANHYDIVSLGLLDPWLPYTIEQYAGLGGAELWATHVIYSGDVSCHLRKTRAEPFALFTDFDRVAMGSSPDIAAGRCPDIWSEMLRTRYDLRIRHPELAEKTVPPNPNLGWVGTLLPGDLVRPVGDDNARFAVVTSNNGSRVTAVTTHEVVPEKWQLVSRARHHT